MAASWQDHFHILDTASPDEDTTSGEWPGAAPSLQPRVVPQYQVIAAPRYSLNGTLHSHVLSDGSGPIVLNNWQVLVRCASWTDVETWAGYLGQIKYFVFHYHDPDAHSSYTQRVLIDQISEVEGKGTEFNYIALPVHLKDATERT